MSNLPTKKHRLAAALANLRANPKRIDVLVACNRANAAALAAIPRSTPITKPN